MPPFEQVPCSLMHDRTHSHNRSAGFKGSLSYRAAYGIPRYTGYCPGADNIPLNTKGTTQRTGKLCDSETRAQLCTATNDVGRRSHYRSTYTANPSDYNPDNRKGGGYWLFERTLGDTGSLSGTSTYANELGNAAENTSATLSRSAGLQTTLANYEQARAKAAAGTLRAPSATQATGKGDAIGYATTYNAMVMKDPLTGGSAAAGAPRMPPAVPSFRHTNLPRAMPSHMDGPSTYVRDYGRYGEDPVRHTTARECDMTMAATTAELAAGSQRVTWHIPGYTGFQCATAHNAKAVEHSMGAEPRGDKQGSAMLYDLQQFPRSRLPGTTTFKAVESRNVTVEQPAHGPPTDTTYGFNNELATQQGMPVLNNQHYINSNKGIMGFYTGGGESISDNGVTSAQTYYQHLRPLEGVAKHAQASRRTVVGGAFPNSSIV